MYGTTNNSTSTLGSLLVRALAVGAMTVLMLANGWAAAKTLYSFQGGKDGAGPHGALILDSAGNLYGTTQYGGGASSCASYDPAGCGTVFELIKNSNGTYSEQVLYTFQGGADGMYPEADLTMDASGNLYGTTIDGGHGNCSVGCGTAFKLTKGSNGTWTESIIYTFQGGATDGQGPGGKLLFDAKGNLYGTTWNGGSSINCGEIGCGFIFELSPTSSGSWTEAILYAFTGNSDGGVPAGTLTMDPDGNFFGTTGRGGPVGTVFELSPTASGYSFATIFTFSGAPGSTTGDFPNGGVVRDAGGVLYGTTICGGIRIRPTSFSPCTEGFGTVFELLRDNNGVYNEVVLERFMGTANISYPDTPLIIGIDGTLWGTSYLGGSKNYLAGGTTFGIVPNSDGTWSQRILARFPGLAVHGGSTPYAGVVQDSAGHLYGTTFAGGQQANGTVYEVTP